jgi:hypothetical protein
VVLDHYVPRLVAALRDQVKVQQRQNDSWCELSQPRVKFKMSRWAGVEGAREGAARRAAADAALWLMCRSGEEFAPTCIQLFGISAPAKLYHLSCPPDQRPAARPQTPFAVITHQRLACALGRPAPDAPPPATMHRSVPIARAVTPLAGKWSALPLSRSTGAAPASSGGAEPTSSRRAEAAPGAAQQQQPAASHEQCKSASATSGPPSHRPAAATGATSAAQQVQQQQGQGQDLPRASQLAMPAPKPKAAAAAAAPPASRVLDDSARKPAEATAEAQPTKAGMQVRPTKQAPRTRSCVFNLAPDT